MEPIHLTREQVAQILREHVAVNYPSHSVEPNELIVNFVLGYRQFDSAIIKKKIV
jgi:hypothetical protein